MLGDDIAAALPEMQRHAESMMVDSCVIDRKTGTTQDPNPPFGTVDVYADPHYSGRCRVQRPGTSVGNADPVVGGYEFGVGTVLLQLPVGAAGVKRDDRVTVSVGGSTDPDLDGLVVTVVANVAKTHPTKRTLICEEVVT